MVHMQRPFSWIAIMMIFGLLGAVPVVHAQESYDDDDAAPHGMSMTASSLKNRLGLSDEQASKLRELRRDYLKATVMQSAKIRVTELELSDLLDETKLSTSKIEKKVKEMESLRGELTLSRVRFLLKAAGFLTPEQFAKFRAMTTRRMGASAAHGAKGMMGHGSKDAPKASPHDGSGMMPHGPMPGTPNPHN